MKKQYLYLFLLLFIGCNSINTNKDNDINYCLLKYKNNIIMKITFTFDNKERIKQIIFDSKIDKKMGEKLFEYPDDYTIEEKEIVRNESETIIWDFGKNQTWKKETPSDKHPLSDANDVELIEHDIGSKDTTNIIGLVLYFNKTKKIIHFFIRIFPSVDIVKEKVDSIFVRDSSKNKYEFQYHFQNTKIIKTYLN